MTRKETIVVAMSGGVDSAVAAALLVEQGHRVIGMMLRLWSETGQEADNRCCTPEAMSLARRCAAHLDIPFYPLDVRGPFRDIVVQSFIDGYAQGVTPNPCLMCNRHIRFGLLRQHALAMGADCLATGHYARVRRPDHGPVQLLQALDEDKDQSYILSGLSQEQLATARFPIGELNKTRVREIAKQAGLPMAQRPDSQDLCFITSGDYRQFLHRHAPQTRNRGPILDPSGETIGQHQGLAFYTIGQRRGLGIHQPHPLYVLEKDVQHNTLVVGERHHLGRRRLTAIQFNWISGDPPLEPFPAQVKIRYRAQIAHARVTPVGSDQVEIQFADPQRDITPGQLAVIYTGEVCLGGGIIQNSG